MPCIPTKTLAILEMDCPFCGKIGRGHLECCFLLSGDEFGVCIVPMYWISCSLQRERDYSSFHALLASWDAMSLFRSVWLAELRGPASVVRELLSAEIGSDDGLAVVELGNTFDLPATEVDGDGIVFEKSGVR